MAAVADNVNAAAGNPVAASPLVGVVNKVFLQIKGTSVPFLFAKRRYLEHPPEDSPPEDSPPQDFPLQHPHCPPQQPFFFMIE